MSSSVCGADVDSQVGNRSRWPFIVSRARARQHQPGEHLQGLPRLGPLPTDIRAVPDGLVAAVGVVSAPSGGRSSCTPCSRSFCGAPIQVPTVRQSLFSPTATGVLWSVGSAKKIAGVGSGATLRTPVMFCASWGAMPNHLFTQTDGCGACRHRRTPRSSLILTGSKEN